MHKGDVVSAVITNITYYGAFAAVGEYTGLVHISEVSDSFVKRIDDFMDVGKKVKLKVVDVDEKRKRLKLSYKALNKEKEGNIPKFTIGFKSLRDRLPFFIHQQKEKDS